MIARNNTVRTTSLRRMRRHFAFALVVAILTFGLGSLEFPELLTLTDNTSNDFALSASVQSAPEEIENQKPTPTPDIAQARHTILLAVNRFTAHEVPLSLHSSTGSLDFLCVRRT
jgi:hypothetical protein